MCGIAGIVTAHTAARLSRGQIARMEAALVHRGPDDGETWIAASGAAGLAHRRLSILDLSPAGHQPMHSQDGRYTIVYNGEIYNFSELRKELVASGVTLRSTGDTEVILELYAREGKECVRRFAGMFAFAIWDDQEQELFLARDPLGIKPLYVWEHEGKIAFASELRAILEANLGPRKLCSEAVAGYLMFGSVQEPYTLVSGVKMLPAGCHLVWQNGTSQTRRYWEINFLSTKDMHRQEATAITRRALDDSIARHFVSDVPVGIFLSGGIDSTAIVALTRDQGFNKLKTFSISFDEAEFNEGDLARRTADEFKTDHQDWRMSAVDAEQLFQRYLESMDQPSNDGFNTFCVSKFAHDCGIKVVLSGLGGDEVFAGYPSFRQVPNLVTWHRYARWLGPGRSLVAKGLASLYATGPKRRLADFLSSGGDITSAYCAMRGTFSQSEVSRLLSHYTLQPESRPAWHDFVSTPNGNCELDQVSYLELTRYMRNQLLRDSDVMSMAWGLELRVPFVDQRLLDSVSPIPAQFRLEQGKKLLIDAVGNIPSWILEQPKRGFRFPFQQWLGNNAEWTEMFRSTLRAIPIPVKSWYQQWMLVVLESALRSLKISV